VAVAPRSYWKSTSRTATQKGIQVDYASAVRHVLQKYPAAQVVLYGHSIGGSIATCVLATFQEQSAPPQSSISEINTNPGEDYSRVSGLILENPFASIPEMVRALYHSPWMPYHYLDPLALDKWDALGAMQSPPPHSVLARLRSHVRVLVSEHDEVVPRVMSENIAQAAGVHENPGHAFGGLTVIRNAMHEDEWQKRQWATEMRRYLDSVRHRARTPYVRPSPPTTVALPKLFGTGKS
jgi:pimeloyl-ACP methyl ester carboxylesterase